VDAIDVKGDALAGLAALGMKPESVQVVAEAPGWYHPHRSGSVRQGRNILATFGELHPRVRELFDIAVPVAVFEIDLDVVPIPKARAGKARPMLEPLPYPPVDRDFAFVVADTVRAGELVDAVRGVDRRLIREVRLFDIYAGTGIPAGHKSLAIAVRLQAPDRTLAEADIDAVAERIVVAAAKATGAVLRR
jgi:phenylalanyl-tRNA synthetase beta chain